MKKLTLFAFVLSGFISQAQRNFTIEEATLTAQKGFGTQSVYSAQWQTNTDVTYIEAPYQSLTAKNIDGKVTTNFVTAADLQKALSKALNKEVKLGTIPFNYHWENNNELSFTYSGDAKYYVVYNISSKEIVKTIKFDEKAAEEVIAPNKNFIVWLNKNNISLSFTNGETIVVTNDPEHIVNGNSYTHRQEFGIDRGIWISPDSKKVLFYKKNETMVADYPLTDFGARIAENKPIKYPMAGMKSEEVSLYIYNVETKQRTKLNIDGDKEQYLTIPTWAPTSDFVYVGVLNRGQDDLKLQRYNTAGSLDKQLFQEKSKTYVEPTTPLKFINDKEFLYVSDKDGYRQMYRYNTNGKQLNSYVYKDVVFKEFSNITSKEIYYLGTANKGMDKLLYKADIKSGKTTPVTKTSATYTVEMNPANTWFYSQYTNFSTPNSISLQEVNGKKSVEIINATNPFEGKITMPKVEMVTVKSADGKTDLNGRLIYPANFNENQKYPVMVYVYGGPHAQLVMNRLGGGAGGFDYYMAQQGFVVFTLDNRGSENRGKNFEHVIHRNLGQNEMADQMKGVEFLKSKKFVDADKIGVYGWSFGGFMTTSLMLNYPDVFKVGVAGGPVIDWKWYEVMYGERYMDTPSENPEGYEKTSTLNKVDKLKGRLLMIHGAQDPVVVQQHSMEFIEACIKAGKQVDYFLYPTHEHNVSGKDRVHLNAKIADYFMTHLKK
ncbi:S9 family peptidase [Flavobacterium sp. xlx-214]|uniref:S9 family peptidase n=1 Tax=unclassified Flavobacterium TaxID=196869 RepID=UPI0013D3EF40|nr:MULTISPECIES: prolyl oligopeptidase family serine peptidase [unclassified Flavobacterium]MBA5791869.1 S9 family peptidase [Flavobacterium sp. xlx-221]QMI83106.1 S9 family peptidase [Flavobacterium sp. xlx-214]